MSLDCERSGRFGDFLREHAALPEETLEQAITHQQQFGGRIGTCLLEIGAIELEELARLLARFHDAPPAPADWLEHPDEQALRVLPLSLIRRCQVLPMRLEPERLHVASMDPSDGALAQELEVTALRDVSVYMLPEVRLMYWLEVHLGIDRHPRFVNLAARSRSRLVVPAGVALTGGAPTGGEAMQGAVPDTAPTGEAVQGGRQPDEPQEPERTGTERTSGAQPAEASPTEAPATPREPTPATAAREAQVAARTAAIGDHWRRQIEASGHGERELLLEDILLEDAAAADLPPAAPHAPQAKWPGPRGLAELEAALEGAADRDSVADAALALARCFADAVGLLIVRDGSVRGFCARGEGIAESIRRFEVPIEGPLSRNNLMTLPIATHNPFRGCPPPDGLDRQLLAALGRPGAREILVHPVRLRGRVLNLLYADNGSAPLGETQVAALRQVCIGLANAYERLLLKLHRRA